MNSISTVVSVGLTSGKGFALYEVANDLERTLSPEVFIRSVLITHVQ